MPSTRIINTVCILYYLKNEHLLYNVSQQLCYPCTSESKSILIDNKNNIWNRGKYIKCTRANLKHKYDQISAKFEHKLILSDISGFYIRWRIIKSTALSSDKLRCT